MTDITITEGDTLDLSVLAENLGAETGSQTIRLLVDGAEVDSQSGVSLDPGIETNLSLAWTTSPGDAGSHTATVEGDDDSVSATVDVLAPAVDVATGAVSDVTPESATVGGDLVSATGVDDVDADIEYRETGAPSWVVVDAATLASPGPFSASLSGLNSNTEYEARAVGAATRYPVSDAGSPVTFQTGEEFISVVTDGVSNVQGGSTVLNGTVTDMPGIGTADVGFEHREVGASSWSTLDAGTRSSAGSFSATLTGLSSRTDYEARAAAADADGPKSDTGNVVTWKTDYPSPAIEDWENYSTGTVAPGGWSSVNGGGQVSNARSYPTGNKSYLVSDNLGGNGKKYIEWTFPANTYNNTLRFNMYEVEANNSQAAVRLDNENGEALVFAGTNSPDIVVEGDNTSTSIDSGRPGRWMRITFDFNWSNNDVTVKYQNADGSNTRSSRTVSVRSAVSPKNLGGIAFSHGGKTSTWGGGSNETYWDATQILTPQ